jgi:hypothetical protein
MSSYVNYVAKVYFVRFLVNCHEFGQLSFQDKGDISHLCVRLKVFKSDKY